MSILATGRAPSGGIGSRGKNPLVFVTGCTRSGTTLLQRMLDSHPMLAVANDSHLVPRSVFGEKVDHRTPLTPALFDEIIGFKRFSVLGIDAPIAAGLAADIEGLAGFVTALLEEFAQRRRKPLAGEKDPEYVRRLPLLNRMFPQARVIHIIRDGRDVALSTLDWVTPKRFLGRLPLWREEPIAVCALWWERQVAVGMEGGRRLGHLYLEIRYEQLVSDPELVLQTVCRFLDLPYSSAMLRFHEERTDHRRGVTSKDQWLPPTVGVRDWRRSLARPQLELFEALAGDLLSSLGYPLSERGSVSCPEVVERARECRRMWLSDLAVQSARPSA